MKSLLPFLIFVIVIVGLLLFSARARRRQAHAVQQRAQGISVGTEVMTTSGLYGTVVARNGDDTVLLSIAPGVEVKWAVAALRDAASLPGQFRGAPPEGQDAPPSGVDMDKRRPADGSSGEPGS
ncbi:MAG TPA: preprotein translocase subunit YajC [Jatrophihabitans sp.]|nr:preprotein translocase subunit YajC [Jatrophihabitans sp.]